MKINKEELIKGLKAVKPGLANNDLIEQSTSFAFKDGYVVAYNDEISIRYPLEGLDVEGVVDASTLLKTAERLKADKNGEVKIKESEGELRLRGHKRKAGIKMDPDIRLPLEQLNVPHEDEEEWTEMPEELLRAMHFCSFSASTDMTKPILTCLFVSQYTVESTDRFRATRYHYNKDKKGGIKKGVNIPAVAIKPLNNYEITDYCLKDPWMHFLTKDGAIFSVRTFPENFPLLDKILNVDGKEIKFPKSTAEMLEGAAVLSEDKDTGTKMAEITIADKEMTVRGEGALGWLEASSPIRYEGPPLGFFVNADFLVQILKEMNEAYYENNKILFCADKWEHALRLYPQEEMKKKRKQTEKDENEDIPF